MLVKIARDVEYLYEMSEKEDQAFFVKQDQVDPWIRESAGTALTNIDSS